MTPNDINQSTRTRSVAARFYAICGWFTRHRGKGIIRALVELSFIGAVLFAVSGYARGPEVDAAAAHVVRWFQALGNAGFSRGWLHPVLSQVVVVVLTFVGFSSVVLVLAATIRRVPGLMELMVCSEFQRRQGHRWSNVELLVALSAPSALTLALVCKTIVAVYATVYFLVCYAYIRFSADATRLESTLNFWARVRTGLEMPVHEHHDHHSYEVADTHHHEHH